ncbi:short-chain dehydrogenase/reductase family protein [Dictyostelium discoideum AX4]|uniref:Short-chain dehydrogenase/reductase family protein n=1 Tax=Dictyostelium discoideum TaxID=44689 RepID=Q54HZ1_DICDI|nr:short-chain dehydrogenase/reductase family protein [Dictyostelium discoideum AX4]EAL62872.1 short-chain dehydrogenase/reductase family protein [Dictyostelium discoideum AX4]|eukprot:XP_636372.1 short-chain dehydrogenase/reductase family protein [Dictyostelium discoideum AX4]
MQAYSNFKVWYCTGTSTGLGLAVVKKLLSIPTNKVVAITRNPQKLEKEIPVEHLPNLLAIKADISSEESIKESISATMEAFGRIDVVVSNAGCSIAGAVEEMSVEEVKKVFDINFFASFIIARNVTPIMRKQGEGFIMIVGSVLSWFCLPEYVAYNASKFALRGLAYTLGLELEKFNIKVMLLSPSGFKTSFINDNQEFSNVLIEGYKTKDVVHWLDSVINDGRGDPEKFAEVLIEMSTKEKPPKNMFFGTSSIDWMEDEFKKQVEELRLNKEVSIGTDFPGVGDTFKLIQDEN